MSIIVDQCNHLCFVQNMLIGGILSATPHRAWAQDPNQRCGSWGGVVGQMDQGFVQLCTRLSELRQ